MLRTVTRRVLGGIASGPLHRPIRRAVRSGLLPARGFRSAPIVENPFTLPVGDTVIRYHAMESDRVGETIYWSGLRGYEWSTMRVFLDAIRTARVVVDVGANTGLYTLVACAAAPNICVVAVEAVPEVAAGLRRNLALNGIEPRVEVVEKVAHATTGTTTFSTSDHGTIGHVTVDAEHGSWHHIELPTVALDDVLSDTLVDVVKLDVEGSELSALLGMRATLARCRPRLLVEVLPWSDGVATQALLEELRYDIFQITSAGVVQIDDVAGATGEGEDQRNFLCLAQT